MQSLLEVVGFVQTYFSGYAASLGPSEFGKSENCLEIAEMKHLAGTNSKCSRKMICFSSLAWFGLLLIV